MLSSLVSSKGLLFEAWEGLEGHSGQPRGSTWGAQGLSFCSRAAPGRHLGSPGGALEMPGGSLLVPGRSPGRIWAPNGRQGGEKTPRPWRGHPFLGSFGYILGPIRGTFFMFFLLVFRPRFFIRFSCILGPIFYGFWEPKSTSEAPRRQKVDLHKHWFYVRRTNVFEDRPFAASAPRRSILVPKIHQKWDEKCKKSNETARSKN